MRFSDIGDMLEDGETVLAHATQRRFAPGGAPLGPNRIYVTNKRVVIRIHKKLNIGLDTESYGFKNITSVKMIEGMFSTSIHMFVKGFTELSKISSEENGVISALYKDQAVHVYKAIRSKIDEDN